MARPTTIKYRDGEVILKNLSVEDTRFTANLLLKSQPEVKFFEEPFERDQCTFSAIGLTKRDDGMFLLVEVRYNPEKKWSYVYKVEEIGKEFHVARGKVSALVGQNVIGKYFKL